MSSSDEVYSKLAVKRRYCLILPLVCFFLLQATNTAMVIYFGVVNKPIPLESQLVNQDPVLTTSRTTQKPTPVFCRCRDTWITYNGSCYLFSQEAKTFSDSEQFCQQHQSHLVKIDNSNENNFLKSHSSDIKGGSRWIGLSDVAIEGEWVWTDGTKPFSVDWNQGEPNGHKTENCAILYDTVQYKWNDGQCGQTYMPICETLLSACQSGEGSING